MTRVAPSAGQLLRPLDERVDLARAAGAVDEADVELLAGGDDRLARLAQVRDVVERIVEPEDVDAVLGRAGDEAPHDVGRDGREPTRNRPRSARPSGVVVRASIARMRSHGLSTARRTAESNTPPPETSRYAKPAVSRISAMREHLAGRQLARERILREQADGGVDDLGHVRVDLIVAREPGREAEASPRASGFAADPVTRGRCSGLRAGRP